MKERETRLNRLFETARIAPVPVAVGTMPGPLKTRVLAHWRAAVPEDAGRGLARVFRFALLGAAVVMTASVAWSYGELAYDPDDDVATANYELREELREDVMP
jgi:hypothetical protein